MQLDDVQILDLSRLLPGPYATHLLAGAGADVIKIEDTETGDYARKTPPLNDDGVGAVFDALNRGKRSVSIDLTTDEGREIFLQLAESADVVFEQFRPGVVDTLGIDFETVRKYNDDIIYCSLSGYGQKGPYRDHVGHDLNYIGATGMLDMTRSDRDQLPEIPGVPTADMSGGLVAAYSIVTALLSRELGGTGGEYIDVSMTDAILSFSQAIAAPTLAGHDVEPGETQLTGQFPCYGVYRTADDRFVTLAALEPKFWKSFCEHINRPDLIEKHMSPSEEQRELVREELESEFSRHTREKWKNMLAGEETMVAPVNTVREALDDPHFRARETLITDNNEPTRVGIPFQSSEGLEGTTDPAPK